MCDIVTEATLALRQANESTERALALLDEARAERDALRRSHDKLEAAYLELGDERDRLACKLNNYREGYARLERDLQRARADHNDEVARLQENA